MENQKLKQLRRELSFLPSADFLRRDSDDNSVDRDKDKPLIKEMDFFSSASLDQAQSHNKITESSSSTHVNVSFFSFLFFLSDLLLSFFMFLFMFFRQDWIYWQQMEI